MKLPFEEWTAQKVFSVNVSKLFQEAFICYRNTAYRASLLFSYLSFLTILKELIIKSVKPVAIPQGRWDDLIRRLQSDDTWEKTVYEELINNSSPIFNINDAIRQQIKYWKDRRNDCAHFKSNEIESHHVESFWSFIKSNLSKVTVEGGKESLLNKFERHFDSTYTPPDAEVSPLIREIDESVDIIDLPSFWEELIARIDDLGLIYHHYESPASSVFNKVLEICSDTTKEQLFDFLKSKQLDLTIINLYQDKINFFRYSAAEVREIWHARLWRDVSQAFPIYAALLRNNLIPKSQIKEANLHVIENAVDHRPNNDIVHSSLSMNGFGDALFEIIVKGRLTDWYHWVNPHADILTYYVEKYPLKKEVVEIICEMYTRGNYSHWLGQRLVNLFNDDQGKKEEFHSIAHTNGHNIPRELK